MRFLRTVAPVVLVAVLATACGSGSGSSSSSGDSTIVRASSGFEVRTVFARYAPGVPLGPQLPKALVTELSGQSCPMRPRITGGMLMECDTGQTVYLLKNPLVDGDVSSATPEQVGHKNIWYVEVHLAADAAHKLAAQQSALTGQQIAFSYDGVVLTAVAMDSSFHPEHFAIIGNYDKASATTLAAKLAA